MAVWRRRPVAKVIVHSDQGSQLGSYRWQSFLKARGLVASMSRRGSCHDNAVAESFFQLLNSSGSGEKSVRTAQPLARMCSNTSRCSATR